MDCNSVSKVNVERGFEIFPSTSGNKVDFAVETMPTDQLALTKKFCDFSYCPRHLWILIVSPRIKRSLCLRRKITF